MTTTVYILSESNDGDGESLLKDKLPSDLLLLKFEDISDQCGTAGSYIKGVVDKKWPLHKTKVTALMKILLKDTEQGMKKLPVYLLGNCAKECQHLAEGDLLAMTKFSVEQNKQQSPQDVPWQVMADPDKTDIQLWVILTATDQPGTSAATNVQQTSVTTGRSYQYTTLKNIKINEFVNVYGVVRFLKPAAKTRGTDFCLFISIVDDSGADKLRCNFFAKNPRELPQVQAIGDVVRFHRLKISMFRDNLQGINLRGFASLVFDGEVGASLEPRTTSTSYTLTPEDKNRVLDLRAWTAAEEDNVLSQVPTVASTRKNHNLGLVTLAESQPLNFFDLICQVVGTCRLPDESVLLKVWDGTKPDFAVKEEDFSKMEASEQLIVDEELQARASGYIVDIYIFDDHRQKAGQIIPGDVVKLLNLHVATYLSMEDPPTVVPYEIDLHGGGANFGRDVILLDFDTEEAKVFTAKLSSKQNRTANKNSDDLFDDEMPGPSTRNVSTHDKRREAITVQDSSEEASITHAIQHNSTTSSKKNEDPPLDIIGHTTHEDATNTTNPNRTESNCIKDLTRSRREDSDNFCMLSTVTVLTAHQEQKYSKLSDIISHSSPYKFRVTCRVQDVQPKVREPRDVVRLYCQHCHYLSKLPETSQVEEAVTCPNCTGSSEERQLEYTMMFQFLLADDTGWVMAGLWRKEAETFFHETTASELLRDEKSFQFLCDRLKRLCPEPSPSTSRESVAAKNTPIMDCCILSYATDSGTCYQLFDTCLDLSDRDSLLI